eukprot:5357464-Prorocentrum_lima.AAC.1
MTSSLVGSEMCIRDRLSGSTPRGTSKSIMASSALPGERGWPLPTRSSSCLLYTSDAADDM